MKKKNIKTTEDSSVIYNTFAKESDIINSNAKRIAVVVFISDGTSIVYDVTNIHNIDKEIERKVSDLTVGCLYHYSFIKKIDNVYFYK